MTMRVKAIEKKLKFTKDPNDAGVYRYVMSLSQPSWRPSPRPRVWDMDQSLCERKEKKKGVHFSGV